MDNNMDDIYFFHILATLYLADFRCQLSNVEKTTFVMKTSVVILCNIHIKTNDKERQYENK